MMRWVGVGLWYLRVRGSSTYWTGVYDVGALGANDADRASIRHKYAGSLDTGAYDLRPRR